MKCPLTKQGKPSTVEFRSHRRTWETRALSKFNAAKIRMLKRQGHAPKQHRYGLMTSKSTFSPEESKSRILRGYCGGRSINRPIKFKMVGPVARPRMHIHPRRSSQVIR